MAKYRSITFDAAHWDIIGRELSPKYDRIGREIFVKKIKTQEVAVSLGLKRQTIDMLLEMLCHQLVERGYLRQEQANRYAVIPLQETGV